MIFVALLFVFLYNISEDKEGYFMTLTWVVGVMFGVGSYEVLYELFIALDDVGKMIST